MRYDRVGTAANRCFKDHFVASIPQDGPDPEMNFHRLCNVRKRTNYRLDIIKRVPRGRTRFRSGQHRLVFKKQGRGAQCPDRSVLSLSQQKIARAMTTAKCRDDYVRIEH